MPSSQRPPEPRLGIMRRFWRSWARDLLIVLLVAFGIRLIVIEANVVPTGSMLPTIRPGDRVLVEKVAYRFRDPQRGEIVTFAPPVPSTDDFVKRVVGLPGDTVAVREGLLYLNGEPQSEPYLAEPPGYTYGPVTVPEGQLLVLGDNRNQSADSHVWGLVERRAVNGRVIIRFWPPGRVGRVR